MKFIPCENLENVTKGISAVVIFAYAGDALVITRKDEYDVIRGEVMSHEDWSTAIQRVSIQNAGVKMNTDTVEIVGYIENSDSTIQLITISYVTDVDFKWNSKVTERYLRSIKKVQKLFTNELLLEILTHVISVQKNKNIQIKFDYVTTESDPNIAKLPVITTQSMGFCKYENKFCIVRDTDENYYSLPGGGCELGEESINCLIREVLEEGQFEIKNITLLGRVIVSLIEKGKVISQIGHDRYLCDVYSVSEFIPEKDGFEIIERNFVNKDELKGKVLLLQNPSGDLILEQLNK